MSIFGADYKYRETLEITDDLDMNENRIKELKNSQDAFDAVNKRYMNKRIEYKTKDLEDRLTSFKSNVENANNETLQRLRIFSTSIQQNREEKEQLKANIESLPDTGDKVLSAKISNDTTVIENRLTNLQQLLDGTMPMSSNLDMGSNRIINAAHPRNTVHDAEYENDVVTAKFLYDYVKIADKTFLKANEDNVMGGRLNMQQQRIIDLADPVNSYDA